MRNLIIGIAFIFYAISYGQVPNTTEMINQSEHLKLNVSNFDQYVNEVFLEEIQYVHLNNSRHYNRLLDLIQNRIYVVYVAYDPLEKYENTLDIPLSNTHNTTLNHDTVFDKDTFNPFKYDLNFFSKYTKIYRIAQTNYVLTILPN